MGYASRSGRAVTNPEHPRAFGVCDDCGIWCNLHKLRYQWEWQGTQLVNLRFRKCDQCLDKPNPQLKARMAPPDPVPVWDPRPESFIQSAYDPSSVPGGLIATSVGGQAGFSGSPSSNPPNYLTTQSGSPLEIE
jgi:hypothetical protein